VTPLVREGVGRRRDAHTDGADSTVNRLLRQESTSPFCRSSIVITILLPVSAPARGVLSKRSIEVRACHGVRGYPRIHPDIRVVTREPRRRAARVRAAIATGSPACGRGG